MKEKLFFKSFKISNTEEREYMKKNKSRSDGYRDDCEDYDVLDEEDEEFEEDEESDEEDELIEEISDENEKIQNLDDDIVLEKESENNEESDDEFESDGYEDDYDLPDGLTREMSEERAGYVHLRHRDNLGRFSSPFQDPERKLDIEMNRKIDKFCREYSRKVLLPYNEKILLLRLVDDFSDREKLLDKKGFLNPKVNHFPRLPYHKVFLDFSNSHSHHLGRSAFSQFINRMVDKGFVKKIKHGHKLYLKISKGGLKRVFDFWEEYPGESWREP